MHSPLEPYGAATSTGACRTASPTLRAMTSHVPTRPRPPRRREPVDLTRSSLSPSRAGDFMTCPLLYRFRVDRPAARAAEPGSHPRHGRARRARAALRPARRRGRSLEAATALRATRGHALLAADEAARRALRRTTTARWPPSGSTAPRQLLATYFALEDPHRLEPAERELELSVELDDGLVLRGYRRPARRRTGRRDARRRLQDRTRPRGVDFEQKALFQMRFYALALWRSARRGAAAAAADVPRRRSGRPLRARRRRPAGDGAQDRGALADAIRRANESGDWRPRRAGSATGAPTVRCCPAWGGTPADPLPGRPVAVSARTSSEHPRLLRVVGRTWAATVVERPVGWNATRQEESPDDRRHRPSGSAPAPTSLSKIYGAGRRRGARARRRVRRVRDRAASPPSWARAVPASRR